MKQQTALEGFFNEMISMFGDGSRVLMLDHFNKFKAIEKEQIKQAYQYPKEIHYNCMTSEDYYNDVYGTTNNTRP